MKCKYCDCYIPDGADVCPSCHKKQDETNGGNKKDDFDVMTNLTVKTNLLAILEDYVGHCNNDNKRIARKTVVFAIKAIDAYGKPLDDEK